MTETFRVSRRRLRLLLKRLYRCSKQSILLFLENITGNSNFLLENEDILQQAIYASRKADSAGYFRNLC